MPELEGSAVTALIDVTWHIQGAEIHITQVDGVTYVNGKPVTPHYALHPKHTNRDKPDESQ